MLRRIAGAPPATLREAIQLAWLWALLSGHRNYGRMDVYLGDFLARDLDEGRITEAQALATLQSLWRLIRARRLIFDGRVILGGRGRRNEANADRLALLAVQATRARLRRLPGAGARGGGQGRPLPAYGAALRRLHRPGARHVRRRRALPGRHPGTLRRDPHRRQPCRRLLALAQAARAEGLHVCLDTSGHAPTVQYAAIAPYADLFLYDYKATDPAAHRRLPGVGNERILANLEALMQAGARVILRCPLVHGVNDDPAHLDGIAALARRYPGLAGVEVMAYHDMGHHKAVRVGQRALLSCLRTATEAQKAAWLDALHRRGCTQARLG